jgi:hypothetical protein
MKKLLISALWMFALSLTSYAQQFDERLLVRFSIEQLEALKLSQPEELKLLSYALDHALYTSNSPAEKGIELAQISYSGDNQTFLDLNLELKDENQYFKIAGSDKVLVMKSRWVLNHELSKK